MSGNPKRKKLSDSFKLLIKNISNLIIVVDDERKIAAVNKAMTHHSDHSVDAYISNHFAELEFLNEKDITLLCGNAKKRLEGKNIASSPDYLKSKMEVEKFG
jgi:hypothetical protein